MSISTLPIVQTASVRRLDLVRRWDDASALTKTRVKVGVLVVSVFAAYHYTLSSLLQTIGFDTPLAYIGLVPLLALGLAWVRRQPRTAEPPIHDRQLDYLIGVPLIAAAMVMAYVLPGHLGDMYWVNRIDLVSLPFFVAGVVVLLFGTRVLWRQKVAILYLFLAWPWPYTTILLGTLGGFTNLTVAGLRRVVKVVPVATALPGIANTGLFNVNHHGQVFPVSVVTACSGVDGMVGFFLVGAGFATLVAGPIIRKVLWLAMGLALLWTTNLLRLLLIFWVGERYGERLAIGILHPLAGLVIFCLGVLLMLLMLRPFGLSLVDFRPTPGNHPRPAIDPTPGMDAGLLPRPPGPARQAVPRIFLAGGVVAIAALLLAVNNSTLRSYDPVASASGEPRLTSFIADPGTPAGWEANYVTEYTANKPLFGASSLWYRFSYGEAPNHQSSELSSSLPVTADVINAGGLSGFAAYGVTACYSFHGYVLHNVAKVSLGNGINGQAMSWTTKDGFQDWTIVYWIWPVKMASTTRYERVILYLQNTAESTVVVPQGVPGGAPPSSVSKTASPADRRLSTNRAFLIDFARQLIAAQTHRADPNATLDSVIEAHQFPLVGSQPNAATASKVAQAKRAELEAHRKAVQRQELAGKLPNGYEGVHISDRN